MQVVDTILNETSWETLQDVDYNYLKDKLSDFDQDFTEKLLNVIVINFSKKDRPFREALRKAKENNYGVINQGYVPITKSIAHAKEVVEYYKKNIRNKTVFIG